MLLKELGYEEEDIQLMKVFEYLDVQRKWFLRRLDFERMEHFAGPASLDTMDAFRQFCFEKYGSLENAFTKIDVDQSGELYFEEFVEAIERLGWDQAQAAGEIFVSLDASRRDGSIGHEEFQ